MPDKVHISGLQASAIVGLDHWKKPVPHPISIDVTFSTNFAKASETDNLHYSLNYAVISDKIASFLQRSNHRNFHSLGGVATAVYGLLEKERAACSQVELEVRAPKVDIRALVSYVVGGMSQGSSSSSEKPGKSGVSGVSEPSDSGSSLSGLYKIHGLRALTLIGVFTFERLKKQFVSLDIDLAVQGPDLDVGQVSEVVHSYLEQANFKTVEALVKSTSQWILQNFPEVEAAGVRVTKPNAIVYTEGVGVSCFYSRDDFAGAIPIAALEGHTSPDEQFDLPVQTHSDYSGDHPVYVAFGSNEGDQLGNISRALELLDQHPQIKVDMTSSLYVSKPMYYTNQPDFYNGVVRLTVSNMSPHELLVVLKDIEYQQLSRVKEFENGPRCIDLDLVLFDRFTVTSHDLVVPHKAMLDRTFVLQPLCELLSPDFTHPVTAEPVHVHLHKLLDSPVDPTVQVSAKLVSVVPGTNKRQFRVNHDGSSPTAIMAIFNATPDSFSDGGDKFQLQKEAIVADAMRMAAEGAQIIDVGGVSTRPGSTEPPVEEELARVLPVVEAIRSEPALDAVLVSVDTYRAAVAEKVLAAGADIINDISMGQYDEAIFDVVARHGCGYIMNHVRGTPTTMSSMTEYGEAPHNLVEYSVGQPPLPNPDQNLVNGICRELTSQLHKAMAQGVRKWQVIIDPGIGFAKNTEQNCAVLRHGGRFKQYAQLDLDLGRYTSFHGMVTLFGASRKKFLGRLTNESTASERDVASAAAATCAVQQRVDILRVHDVKSTKQTVQVADAVFRK